MANVGNPVGAGLIASLARPGGNVTGLASLSPELNTKRLEILKDTVPNLARVGFIRERRAVASSERAQTCSFSAESKIGGDRDSS